MAAIEEAAIAARNSLPAVPEGDETEHDSSGAGSGTSAMFGVGEDEYSELSSYNTPNSSTANTPNSSTLANTPPSSSSYNIGFAGEGEGSSSSETITGSWERALPEPVRQMPQRAKKSLPAMNAVMRRLADMDEEVPAAW